MRLCLYLIITAFLVEGSLGKALPPNSTQRALKLNPRVLQNASFTNGNPIGNQSASLTSHDNFINFCISRHALGAKLMNGAQSTDNYSCNSIPMGMIVAPEHMPSCKFKHPHNLSKLKANKEFKIILKIKKMVTGNFVNPNNSYFAAPQQLSTKTKEVIGHAHVVIQSIPSLNSTAVLDPRKFVFFKGIDNHVAKDGTSTVEVTGGLPVGAYRLGSMLTAANHQPVLAGIAQRGLFDDVVYFVVE
ncbi:hypothetical protein MJO28_012548 [Puccinia striiformis f. sp. tritici]|uniref:Uncharacterized protein n=4 Tax=Puccinia striiformis TaxID=27350 RepID=A0A0L0VRE3_9BASI|nr:hypothetical protein Pst134EA_022565 [Puccinia striiformis f. sp. tritici]KAI9605725.1 hypothetical protein H4Q26_004090 [Puccinia striiformis f. sp. tritici PST-130]KNF01560.1 hypothetical protein PSTG_05339 [Puccinia striiformis f. sp. tritici PST-78]POW01297.1 hypothetical protein PSHT_12595 [Puccinia striiformis]KAH9445615.1 hypothetical protein Pst134EB_023451 [Puccinia striiformis f. sp. tritici]KAH9455089.1 hypothetical protein Pst134EA_022565 [Puccinia striiformis f. sp. tritici]